MEDNYTPGNIVRDTSGGGSEEDSQDFAGLGGSFAGPMGQLTSAFLQARLSGMNRATVSPRVNQRRVMNSPEFAMAKALGIPAPYNNYTDRPRVARRTMDGISYAPRPSLNDPSVVAAAAGVAGLTDLPRFARFEPRAPLPDEGSATPPSQTPPQPIPPYGTPSATPPASEPGPAAPAGAGKDEPQPSSPTAADPRKKNKPVGVNRPTITTTGRII